MASFGETESTIGLTRLRGHMCPRAMVHACLCMDRDDFALHAATRAGSADAAEREAFLKYTVRPAVAQDRIIPGKGRRSPHSPQARILGRHRCGRDGSAPAAEARSTVCVSGLSERVRTCDGRAWGFWRPEARDMCSKTF